MANEAKYVYEDGSVNEVAIAHELLAILQAYAPNKMTQEGVARSFNFMRSDGLSWGQMVRNLSGILHDGAHYGNWPWIVTSAEKVE